MLCIAEANMHLTGPGGNAQLQEAHAGQAIRATMYMAEARGNVQVAVGCLLQQEHAGPALPADTALRWLQALQK